MGGRRTLGSDDRSERRAKPPVPRAGERRDPDRPRRGLDRELPPVVRKKWAADGDLPRWIHDEVSRVTAKQKIAGTLELLQTAAAAFAAAKHGKARHLLEEAKELSPRTATIRELLGLSAYRLGRWDQALRELRTFRRLTGEVTHMPVEMDVLRALDRPADVEATWHSFRRIGGERDTEREARVVYASFLLDQGRDREAWEVSDPKRMSPSPRDSELRVWFVAARAAARLGDFRTARRLYETLQSAAPGFPGLDELDRATTRTDS
jgi:tetratricopeptide (TPR) repeat protein